MGQRLKTFFKEFRFYTILIVVALVLAAGLRVFVIASIIKIPSGSMSPTVLPGDKIIVTKLIPGPRVYKDIREIRVDGKVQTKRFKGIRRVKRNDVLLFNFPYSSGRNKIDMNLNVFYLKRCVALPGDTFLIENGIYRVKNCPDSIGCISGQRELSLTSQEDFPPNVWSCMPKETDFYKWNIKDFGPLYVPSSGATLTLDTFNYFLYRKLIEYETDKTLSVRDGLIYLEDERISDYTFRMNYYFMAGDWARDSQDSRYWGLLPEDCIIGKAVLVWRSAEISSGKIRWNRFLKIIR